MYHQLTNMYQLCIHICLACIASISKKNIRWCADVKTQKGCGVVLTQEINLGPKITNHFHRTLHKYLQHYKAKDKSCTYMEVVCLILSPSLTSWVSTTLTLYGSFLGFDVTTSFSFLLKFFLFFLLYQWFTSSFNCIVNILSAIIIKMYLE